MVPTGFRFCPTDEELIEILHHKASGNTATGSFDFIIERNLYDLDPKDLNWNESSVRLNKNERYYYCRRESDSREVMGRGWWKATSHVKVILSTNGDLMGYKRPLTFHRFKDDNQRNRKAAIKTDWIMHEYGLQSVPSDWRLCKIKYKGKDNLKEVMTSMENTCRNNTTPPLSSFEAEDGGGGSSSSSISTNITPMQPEFGFQQLPPLMQLPLPENDNLFYDNYCWLNSNIVLNDDDDYVLADQLYTLSEQPFSDLWSWDS
ncbi:Ribosomal protein L12/ ATP-dependent Clp protease adaptor protein ClpS family protein [Hibiscus syriacus]|uniref:Ribosomal protein L12/ ATP-dependent Clp protease adaptor protein ClpS family protein n=1 Tax=Hibiscus syriacus TaxID=106335 RepID=A0A6A3CPN6_HIBSY|nr:Ribosomal protein L12/ ATP-dependent Clp protease adaptor protein ClpS family protein [Hibiscus syriacus]